MKHIIGISAYASAPQFQSITATSHHNHDHSGDPHPPGEHTNDATHYEMRGISSLQVSCPVLDASRRDRLDEWIRTVLWENCLPDGPADSGLQVLRCKGLFTLDSGEQYVLQGVRSLYEISRAEGQGVLGVPEPGKIVLIGKGLDDDVRRSLESTLA